MSFNEVLTKRKSVMGIDRLRKSRGQKIDLISLLLNNFFCNFADLYLLRQGILEFSNHEIKSCQTNYMLKNVSGL